MKIFWVCHFLPFPATGFGALQRTHHLVRQLARRFEVHLFAVRTGSGTTEDVLGMGVASCHLSPAKPIPSRLLAGVAGMAGPRTYWEHLFDHRALQVALANAARGGAGILLLDTLYLEPYRRSAPCLPLVVTHHNVESDLARQRAALHTGPLRGFLNRQAQLTERLEATLCPAASLNLAVSADDETRLRAIAGDVPLFTVPNGVDIDYFRPDPSVTRAPHSLVFAGGMDWFPNREAIQWLAQDVWPRLVEREPRRTLTVIGKAPPPEIEALAARDSRVRVLGFVPDIRPHIAAASAYICPIRVGGGTRLKVLDALAMGVPLVATPLAVEGLGLGDGTHFLGATTADAFVEQLQRLDDDPDLGARVAGAGRSLVERAFSWDGIGERLAARLLRVA